MSNKFRFLLFPNHTSQIVVIWSPFVCFLAFRVRGNNVSTSSNTYKLIVIAESIEWAICVFLTSMPALTWDQRLLTPDLLSRRQGPRPNQLSFLVVQMPYQDGTSSGPDPILLLGTAGDNKLMIDIGIRSRETLFIFIVSDHFLLHIIIYLAHTSRQSL